MNAPKLESLAQSKTEPQHAHAAFTLADIGAHLAVLPDWHYKEGRIVKSFHFKNYYETIAFVNVVASISHATDHHPALVDWDIFLRSTGAPDRASGRPNRRGCHWRSRGNSASHRDEDCH